MLLELAKALAPHFANHKLVQHWQHGWMYHQQQLDVATFDAETEATVLVDYAATAALSAKYVLGGSAGGVNNFASPLKWLLNGSSRATSGLDVPLNEPDRGHDERTRDHRVSRVP
jgi:hypothetical protein